MGNAVNRVAVVTGHDRENVLARLLVQRQEKKFKTYHALFRTAQVGSIFLFAQHTFVKTGFVQLLPAINSILFCLFNTAFFSLAL
jgi:hypothetical protein